MQMAILAHTICSLLGWHGRGPHTIIGNVKLESCCMIPPGMHPGVLGPAAVADVQRISISSIYGFLLAR